MKVPSNIFLLALAASLASGPGLARASGFSFDAPSAGLALADAPEAPRAAAAPAPARLYDFGTLYKSLGYPSPDLFGSTAEEVSDLDAYTSQEDPIYTEINGYLRYYPAPYDWSGTGPEDARVIVARMDNIFARVPALPEDAVLLRGLGLGYRDNEPYTPGEEFVDKGYVSATASFKVAYHFAVEMDGREEKPSRRAVFALYFTRPERAILVDQGEDEAILPHGRRFRVMAARPGGKYDLYLVQLCAASCETAVRPAAAAFWASFSPAD